MPARTSTVAVEVLNISRRFGDTVALHDVSLRLGPGGVHALLGPNGSGKTTLLRILLGLTEPTSGTVRIMGMPPGRRVRRALVGLVPAGSRTFYHRLSGLENLVFFARLHGMPYAMALARAREVLVQVGLQSAAHLRVGKYSHGMQSCLGLARAFLADPPVLLADEATHDLDPEAARRVQGLVRLAAERGTTVVWATQRVDEIEGFAHTVILLAQGRVRFAGPVEHLLAHSARRYVLNVEDGRSAAGALGEVLSRALGRLGDVTAPPGTADGHVTLDLADGVALGDAIAALAAAGVKVTSCRQERSGMEEAFLRLTGSSMP
ncbi:MAG: ABC transporter ATP-binding protein [Armatimonadota bacterium]|nr:ABC transporter ATP-binding protein [Armatimonadota bacterium]